MANGPLDLKVPSHAYLFGFLQGDGTLGKTKERGENDGRGRLSVELGKKDRSLLEAFQKLLPCNSTLNDRVRDTNFKAGYESTVWGVFDQETRLQVEALGIPLGRKSIIVKPPTAPHVVEDYWRGLIDADGSVGLTGLGYPFVSLITSSDHIALAYLNFLFGLTGNRKSSSRNKRDGVYNIMVLKEDAQLVAARLYYDGALSLDRKNVNAAAAIAWIRPPGFRRRASAPRWLPHEDALLLQLGPEDSKETLPGRGDQARRQRFNKLRRGAVKYPERLLYAGMPEEEFAAVHAANLLLFGS